MTTHLFGTFFNKNINQTAVVEAKISWNSQKQPLYDPNMALTWSLQLILAEL